MKKVPFTLVLLVFLSTQGAAQDDFLIKVSPANPEETKLLSDSEVRAYAKTADYYLAEATSENLEYLESVGIYYKVIDKEPEYALYYFVWTKPGEDISSYLERIKEKASILEVEGSRAIVKGHPRKVKELTSLGLGLELIRKRDLPIKSEEVHPFTLEEKVPAFSPFIDQIMQQVSTSKLIDYVADLSGENEVIIGGHPETLLTRNTYTDKCNKAGQYILEKFESLGLTAWYDTFSIPLIEPDYILDVESTPDGNTAWFGGHTGVWKTTDAGNNWYQISGTDQYLVLGMSTPNPDTLYGTGTSGLIIKSIDGGDSWFELQSPTTTNLRFPYFLDSQMGWVVGFSGKIYHTTDGGQNWSEQISGVSQDLEAIAFIDSNNGWIVGDGGTILHTTDGGNNWSPQTSGTNNLILGVTFVTPNKGWICGSNGYLRYTTDAGTNWNSQTSGTSQWLHAVSAPDSLHAWVSGLGGVIIHTTNAGINWIRQPCRPSGEGWFYDVYFSDTLIGYTVGHNDIFYTSDGGQNWIQQINHVHPRLERYNVVAEMPGFAKPGKECLITAHYDATSEDDANYTPGANDNASGCAAVLTVAEILQNHTFDYTLKFIIFSGNEQGLFGSEDYAERAHLRGDTIIGVYNLDMIAWDGDDINNMDLHASTRSSSMALADIITEVINDYSLSLIPQKITTGAVSDADHASFWKYSYPAILVCNDLGDADPYMRTTGDRLSNLDLPYFTDMCKASIASVAILAQPFIYGDVDRDINVTVSDVIYIINYLFKGGPAPDPLEAGDVNCDGDVGISDVIYLINYLFKGGPDPGC